MAAKPGGGLGSERPFKPLPKGKKPTPPPQATAKASNSDTKQAQGNNSQGGGHGVKNDFLSETLAGAEKAFKDGKLQEWLEHKMRVVLGSWGAFAFLNLMAAEVKAATFIDFQAELASIKDVQQISSEALKLPNAK